MSENTYLTRKEAAAVCGCAEYTIRRYQRDGKLPAARKRDDGVTEVAVADLVTAGLLDPLAACGPVEQVARRSQAERDVVDLRRELAVVTVRLEELVKQLARAEDEAAFLRAYLLERGA